MSKSLSEDDGEIHHKTDCKFGNLNTRTVNVEANSKTQQQIHKCDSNIRTMKTSTLKSKLKGKVS